MKTTNTVSEYDTQAETFLTQHGLKFRATLSDSKNCPWQEGYKPHWRVTISRANIKRIAGLPYAMVTPGHASLRNSARLTFDFWGNDAKPCSVLACIGSDVHCPDTFEDFCAEYGYDQDSRKDLQTFKRASKFSERLRHFFTEQELADLSQIN